MYAALSDEQESLAALARDVATATPSWDALRSSGLLDLRADGAGTLELALCAEAFGAALSATPFLGAALGRELLPGVGGNAVAALDGDLAPDAFDADAVLVLDGTQVRSGPAIPATTADRSRVAARAGASTVVGSGNAERFTAVALVLLAADLVGTGAASLAEAVAHTRERHQFGVPVATFQAVQHLAADAHVELVAARNLVWSAAWRLDQTDDLDAARRAKAIASEAGRNACEVACQLLGGLGHTWEHPASTRLRRAMVSRALLGDERIQYDALLDAPPSRTPSGLAGDGYDLRDGPVEADLRTRLRAWLVDHAGDDDWHRSLASGGWVGLSMPIDAGGQGLPATCEAIVSEELGEAGAPPPPPIGHLAHALATFGTPAQRADHLAHMLDGTQRWCQGFSEPDAGSDLASVRTRARRDGDRVVVDGRKIWTSGATEADWCLLLCRTGDEPGHRSLSMLLVPLDSPGVEVSPIRTAWGSDEFAEVAFAGVEVPITNLLGDPGQGWAIAMSLLAVERGPADIGWISRFRRTATALLAQPRVEVARAIAWLDALDATVAATLTRRAAGGDDTVAGSVDKLLMTKVDQLLHAAALDQAGIPEDGEALTRYLWSRAAAVMGGTSQIQRTIVAQRILGMPRG